MLFQKDRKLVYLKSGSVLYLTLAVTFQTVIGEQIGVFFPALTSTQAIKLIVEPSLQL